MAVTQPTTVTPYLSVLGLPEASAGMRLIGATATGAPTSGTHLLGDVAFDQAGHAYVCTAAGTPGTFTALGGATPTLAQVLAAGNTDGGKGASFTGLVTLGGGASLPSGQTFTNSGTISGGAVNPNTVTMRLSASQASTPINFLFNMNPGITAVAIAQYGQYSQINLYTNYNATAITGLNIASPLVTLTGNTGEPASVPSGILEFVSHYVNGAYNTNWYLYADGDAAGSFRFRGQSPTSTNIVTAMTLTTAGVAALSLLVQSDPIATASTTGIGVTTGIGNGAAANITAPAQGTGSGPASLAVNTWIRATSGTVSGWIPFFT